MTSSFVQRFFMVSGEMIIDSGWNAQPSPVVSIMSTP
jgi:hypothetical protein